MKKIEEERNTISVDDIESLNEAMNLQNNEYLTYIDSEKRNISSIASGYKLNNKGVQPNLHQDIATELQNITDPPDNLFQEDDQNDIDQSNGINSISTRKTKCWWQWI